MRTARADAHFCTGAGLARLVGEVAITAVLDRYPALRLVTGRPRRDPRRMDLQEEIVIQGRVPRAEESPAASRRTGG